MRPKLLNADEFYIKKFLLSSILHIYIKNTVWARCLLYNRFFYLWCCGLLHGNISANWSADVFVAVKTLAIVSIDNHRGWPYLDARLDLLNVVGSKPLMRAKALHVILFLRAKFSIAFHKSSCVNILFSICFMFLLSVI